jgi:hypothetical protein
VAAFIAATEILNDKAKGGSSDIATTVRHIRDSALFLVRTVA